MTFTIGSTDLMPYIADGGLQWTQKDVEGPNAGTAINGDAIRDVRATKYEWRISCMPLTAAELSTILTLIAPEFVTLTYTDPQTNSDTSAQVYINTAGLTFKHRTINGTEYFAGLTFPVQQK